MKNICIIILVCAFFLSCKSKTQDSQESDQPPSSLQSTTTETYETEPEVTEQYEDGEYCATIEYYNSSTGKSSTYTLNVQIENGELVRIDWTNGGWLDSSHFGTPEVDADGSCSFTTFDGKSYDVQIEGPEDC